MSLEGVERSLCHEVSLEGVERSLCHKRWCHERVLRGLCLMRGVIRGVCVMRGC